MAAAQLVRSGFIYQLSQGSQKESGEILKHIYSANMPLSVCTHTKWRTDGFLVEREAEILSD